KGPVPSGRSLANSARGGENFPTLNSEQEITATLDDPRAAVADDVRARRAGHAMALTSALLWSAVFTLLRWVQGQGVGAVELYLARFGVFTIGLVLVGLVRRPDLRSFGWRGFGLVAVMSVLAGPGYQILQNYGAVGTDSGLMAMLHTTQALHTAWMAAILLRERFYLADALAIVLASAGIGLVLSGGKWDYETLRYPGALCIVAMIAGLCNALVRRLLRRVRTWDLVWLMYLLGFIFSLPLISRGAIEQWRAMSPRVWLAVLYLAIPAQLVAILLWYAALKRLRAATVSFYTFVIMIGAAAWGWLRGEIPSWIDIIGMGVVMAALAINIRARPADKPSAVTIEEV
ncbi:MAG: DMT family transporter, partial [Tepidisphaeraceae bacterium]